MSRAHFFLDFVIQCNIFIYSEIHALYYYDIYFDLSIRQFTSASCMSWMSAICVHMQMATFGLVRMRIVSFATVFRFVTQHSSLCNAPSRWERHCVTTLKRLWRRLWWEGFVLKSRNLFILCWLNIQDCCKSEWGSNKSGKGGWK